MRLTNGEVKVASTDLEEPTSNGLATYKSKYIFILDLVPAVPHLNNGVGPIAGDLGKISIMISEGEASNVFTYIATQIIFGSV